MMRLEALKELRECYSALADANDRYQRETAPGRWQPPPHVLEEIECDWASYSERIGQLEAFLASET
jgi:hypothetical protein